LREAQRDVCCEILKAELHHFSPHWAVFLTETNDQSGYFYSFQKCLDLDLKERSDLKYVRAVGKLRVRDHEYGVVLAQQPQRRSPKKVADDVLQAMEPDLGRPAANLLSTLPQIDTNYPWSGPSGT
jgi:hypothetical protein